MSNAIFINNGQPSIEWPEPDTADDVPADISPDALMAYCQSRLDSIDGQVKASFADQQTNASTITQPEPP